MRPIDADAALKALRKCQTYLYDTRDPDLKIKLSSAKAAINNLPTIQPEKAQLFSESTTSDPISRQAAIDAFEDTTFTKNEIRRRLLEVPSVQPEPQWIPVSERLPEVHESGNSASGIYMQSNPVLVYGTCEYEDNAQFHVVTYCDDLDGNTYWSTELDAITVSGVIAWMPLPEAYKPNK